MVIYSRLQKIFSHWRPTMEIFNLTLRQTMMMFLFIVIGFVLRKTKILPENSDTAMSRLETYVFVPALNLYNMLNNCTVKNFTQNSVLIAYGGVLIVVAIALAYVLSRIFVPKTDGSPDLAYRRNVYKYAMTFGNYGFMGNFIVLGVWGEAFFFKYSMLTLSVALFCGSWGLYILIPKDKNVGSVWKNISKGIFAPPMIALAVGVICGLLGLRRYVPEIIISALSNASDCMGPVAMLLAGFVIAGYDFKGLLKGKKVYVATVLRLIVIPAVMMLLLKAIGTNDEIMTLALIAFATPLGLNTIVYPAAYGGETRTGASMAMISHTLSVVTIPLMYLIFIVLL